MKRIIIFSLLIALIVPVFCFAASAESLNYEDYITNIRIDEGKSIVTIDLPCHSNRYDVYPSLGEGESAFQQSLTYTFQPYSTGIDYDINLSPCWDGRTVNFLSLLNLPNNVEVNAWINIESRKYQSIQPVIPSADYYWSTSGVRFQYYFDGQRVGTSLGSFGLWDNQPIEGDNFYTFQFYGDGVLRDPNPYPDDEKQPEYFHSANNVYPTFYLNNVRFEQATDLTFTIVKYQLVIHLEELLFSDGNYTKLLEIINQRLAEQGKFLDQITGVIKAVPTPIPPSGSDIVGDILDSEGNLTGYAQGNLHVIDSYMNGISGILADLSPLFWLLLLFLIGL